MNKLKLTCDNGYGRVTSVELSRECSIDEFFDACKVLAVGASYASEQVIAYFDELGED